MCDRCKNPDVTNVNEYTITKGSTTRKTTLCDNCAELTRATYKLSGGGKATEAKPSAPEPEADDSKAQAAVQHTEPLRPARRRP